ncbi:MAG: SMP-30/gluconolactonase/LRE family protein, partial [Albidovulum sp.]|uniref:SMP-30/gluconolactonase/LRE family protein n=1 Tax=Albidovulum sp. TaxID=1872424 RepID=UPI003C887E8B
VDTDTLLVASETGLDLFDLRNGKSNRVTELEADTPHTRSNDGRADPWGGFWIGTMGKGAEPGAGTIWRYWRGEVRKLYAPLTIPNAISFTPDRRFAHFADSATAKVWRVALDTREGWPASPPELYLDLGPDGLTPDGAVCDAKGNLWLAEWGAGRVACHAPDGRLIQTVPVGGHHSSCPAFGGHNLRTLFVTSARQGLSPQTLADTPSNGCTFACKVEATGLAEHRVVL